jgi:hypothetical protein
MEVFSNRQQFPMLQPTLGKGWGVNLAEAHTTSRADLEQIRAAGFDWVRITINWHVTEHGGKGRYWFNLPGMDLDRFFKDCREVGLRILCILYSSYPLYLSPVQRHGGTNGLCFGPNTPELREGFAKWAQTVVQRYRNQGVFWEIWNEPNLYPFWRPSPNIDDFIAFALHVGKAIREVAPDEYLVGPGLSLFDWTWLTACFKAGLLEYWDAVSIHPYRDGGETRSPESIQPEVKRLRSLIGRYKPKGKTIPIISSEWGYSETYIGFELPPTEYAPTQAIANKNLLRWSEDFSKSDWKGYWIKPPIKTGVLDPLGTNRACELGTADRQESPDPYFSGLIQDGPLEVGKYYITSLWMRTTSGTMDVWFGPGWSPDMRKKVTIDTTWRKYSFTCKARYHFLGRSFQVWEATRDNAPWQIAFPQVELCADIDEPKAKLLRQATQADLAVRMHRACVANRMPLHIHFNWRDSGSDPANPDQNYGVLNEDGTPPSPPSGRYRTW